MRRGQPPINRMAFADSFGERGWGLQLRDHYIVYRRDCDVTQRSGVVSAPRDGELVLVVRRKRARGRDHWHPAMDRCAVV